MIRDTTNLTCSQVGFSFDAQLKFKSKIAGLARQPSDFLWLISKKVTKETICAALGICVCSDAVLLLSIAATAGVVLRGKEIKGAFSPWAPASTINGVDEVLL